MRDAIALMGRAVAGLRTAFRRLLATAGAGRGADDVADEFRAHVELYVDDRVRAGVSPADARREALLAFGGVDNAMLRYRDRQRLPFVDDLITDVRHAVRVLARGRSATVVALATLAIGVGVNVAVFSVVNTVLLSPPYPDADRIMWLAAKTPGGVAASVSTLEYLGWKQSTSFEAIAGWSTATATLARPGGARQLRTLRVAPAYFDLFGITPVAGRLFAAGEDRPGADRVAVIGARLWAQEFGRDPAAVGRTIALSGEAYRVVGVVGEGAGADWEWTEVWLPLTFRPEHMNATYAWLGAYGKLKRGVALAAARTEMDGIAARSGADHASPGGGQGASGSGQDASRSGRGVLVQPYAEVFAGPGLRHSLWLLLAAVGAVLLIGCANLSSLTLARTVARSRELAIRAALGGGRARIVRQLCTEHLVLALAGGAAGVGTGYACMMLLKRLLPPFSSPGAGVPPRITAAMDGRVLLFALALSVASAVVFGLAPVLVSGERHLPDALRDGARAGTGPSHRRLRRALICAEVAVATMLVASAGALVHSLLNVQGVDVGFDSRGLVAATVPLTTRETLGNPAERAAYFDRLLAAVTAIPGARAAALTSALPLSGPGSEVPFQRADAAPSDLSRRPTCFFKMITPDYFRTLGLALIAGRGIDRRDDAGAARVAVVNRTFARQVFGGASPIGQRLLVPAVVQQGAARFGPDEIWEVVGVVTDERIGGPTAAADTPGMYVSMSQSPTRHPALLVRAERPGLDMESAIRGAVASVNGEQPLADVRLVDEMKSDAIAPQRTRAELLAAFALIAVALSGVGIYGLMSFTAVQRASELGVRAALGATARQLRLLFVAEAGAAALTGVALGLPAAIAVNRLLASMLFGVEAADPVALSSAALVLLLASGAASYIPARRAAAADASRALRGD
jgi:putative ABC transport system permease protein